MKSFWILACVSAVFTVLFVALFTKYGAIATISIFALFVVVVTLVVSVLSHIVMQSRKGPGVAMNNLPKKDLW